MIFQVDVAQMLYIHIYIYINGSLWIYEYMICCFDMVRCPILSYIVLYMLLTAFIAVYMQILPRYSLHHLEDQIPCLAQSTNSSLGHLGLFLNPIPMLVLQFWGSKCLPCLENRRFGSRTFKTPAPWASSHSP